MFAVLSSSILGGRCYLFLILIELKIADSIFSADSLFDVPITLSTLI